MLAGLPHCVVDVKAVVTVPALEEYHDKVLEFPEAGTWYFKQKIVAVVNSLRETGDNWIEPYLKVSSQCGSAMKLINLGYQYSATRQGTRSIGTRTWLDQPRPFWPEVGAVAR